MEVKHLVLLKVGALQADALDGQAHVKKILKGKVIGLGLQSPELARLAEQRVDGRSIIAEGHRVYLVLAELAETTALEQCANLAKLYLVLEIAGINHDCKVTQKFMPKDSFLL